MCSTPAVLGIFWVIYAQQQSYVNDPSVLWSWHVSEVNWMKKEAAHCYLGFYNVKSLLIMLERNTGIHLHPGVLVVPVDHSPFREHLQSTLVQGHGQPNTKGTQSKDFTLTAKVYYFLFNYYLDFLQLLTRQFGWIQPKSVESCFSYGIGVEMNYLNVKGKKNPKAQKLIWICIKTEYSLCKLILISWTLKTSIGLDNHLQMSCSCEVINGFYNSF